MTTDDPFQRIPPMKHENINVPSYQMQELIDLVERNHRYLVIIEQGCWKQDMQSWLYLCAVTTLAGLVVGFIVGWGLL